MFFIVLGVFIGQMLLLSTKINFLLPTNKVSIIKRGGMIMNQKMIDHQSNDLNDLIGSEFSIDNDDRDDTNNHKNKIERKNVNNNDNNNKNNNFALNFPTAAPKKAVSPMIKHVKNIRKSKTPKFLSSKFNIIKKYGAQRHKTLIMVLSRKEKFTNHLESLPKNWFNEMNVFADVVYIVGGGEGRTKTTLHRLTLDDNEESLTVGVLTLAQVSDVEYPPLTKTTMAYEFFATRFQYNFVLKCDDDTYIHPPRLNNLLTGRNPKDIMYMGRPLHHCGCIKSGFDAKLDKCKKEIGVHYCSGAAYVLSSATLEKMLPYWKSCRNLTNLALHHNFQCKSSDSTVGWCLNQAGIFPSRAIDDSSRTQFPKAGDSYSWPDEKTGYKQKVKTLFCQELHMDGGVDNIGVAGKPYLYPKKDINLCVLYHPLKRKEHFRYIRYAITHKVEDPAYSKLNMKRNKVIAMNERDVKANEETCQLAIGILCRASSYLARYAIRSTWGELANALRTVKVYFLLGHTKLSPHLMKELKAENETYKDIVLLNMTDSYRNLFQKSYRWFEHASKNTNCKYIFKTDDDGYVRVLTLLDHVRNYQRKIGPENEIYFGNQMWDSGDVIKEKKNQWYMYDMYPHDKFPYYMSGSGYGMSSKLAKFASYQAAKEPNFRVEDAGMGICVSKYPDKEKVKFLAIGSKVDEWGKMTCKDTKDILDNPAFNLDFNMYISFHNDLDGKFCEGKEKRNLANPSSHVMSKEEIYDYHPYGVPIVKFDDDGNPKADKKKNNILVTPPAPWEWKNHPKMLKDEIFWGEMVNGVIYYGEQVARRLNAQEITFAEKARDTAFAHLKSKYVVEDEEPLKIMGFWKVVDNWEVSDFLILIRCNDEEELVYVPFRGGVFLKPVTSMRVGSPPLAIVMPFACRVDTLKRFFDTVAIEFSKVKGANKKKIIIAWGFCNTDEYEDNKVGGGAIEEIINPFREKMGGKIPVIIKGTNKRFSRGSTLNLGLSLVNKDDIAVVLDVDMSVQKGYFYRSRAFARDGQSAYFPITFSNYNPATLNKGYKDKTKPDDISYRSGRWREFGYGMLSVNINDFKQGFDAKNKMWGMEDVQMYDIIKKQGIFAYRVHDTSIKHIWHEKHCGHLKSIDKKRYFMCVGSKLGVEGNWRQQGAQVLELQDALNGQAKTGLSG